MNKIAKLLVFFFCAMLLSPFGLAAENASKEDAIAMVKKGVAYYKAKGREASIAAFTDSEGEFRKGQLFLVVVDLDGKVLGHTGMKKMIGANIAELKDMNGVYMMKDIFEKAKKSNSGWSVEYLWLNPDSKKMEPKITYFEKYDDLVFFCGIYK